MPAANTAQAQVATPVITTLPGGRVQVKNTGPSKWVGTTGWKLVLERTIAPAEGSPGMLERPWSIAITKEGQILVVDDSNNSLLQFGADGKFLRKLAGKGRGPGEYEDFLIIDSRDNVIVGNAPNSPKLMFWRTDGTVIREWTTSANSCQSGPTLLDAKGAVLIPECIKVGSVNRNAMVRHSPTGAAIDTILLPMFPTNTAFWRMPNGGAQRIPFSPGTPGTYDSQFRYVYGHNDSYTLIVANRGTDTARIIQLPGNRQTIPTRILDSLYERTQRGALKGIAKRSDFPSQYPFFNDLHSDEFDNIWIDRPGPDGKTAQYDVVDRDGRFLGVVAAPTGLTRGPVWRNGRMYRASENADGLPVIEVFRVDRGKY